MDSGSLGMGAGKVKQKKLGLLAGVCDHPPTWYLEVPGLFWGEFLGRLGIPTFILKISPLPGSVCEILRGSPTHDD